MAIKAVFWISNPDPQADGSYRLLLTIFSGQNNAVNVPNDEYFAPGALSATVNGSLNTFVEGYIQSEWSVSFNPLMDSVKCINPISLL